MSWQLIAAHDWQEPLAFAGRAAGLPEMALLYSGRQEKFSGRTSYLFLEPAEHRQGSDWSALPIAETSPQWIGYLGYGMRLNLERYHRGAAPFIALPDFWLTRYRRMFRFDHDARSIEEFADEKLAPFLWPVAPAAAKPIVAELRSNFTRRGYEQAVAATIEKIRAGDFYQANLTRKFYGNFAGAPDAWSIFRALAAASPAPYSAFIRHGGAAILSSSPECFLSLKDGQIISRPIKGSAARSTNAAEDKQLHDALLASEKNAAENLMIVDLMRNDLARIAEPGSVEVSEQSALYSYATIHHLVSTVTAHKKAGASVSDVLRACFPPGSMTGAPKIAAVQWCEAEEKLERGVYSGAIGWLGKDSCDLSVVIRTLLIDGARFEFQVGGGIVADSDPAEEWQETLVKARGIAAALEIEEETLAAL